MIKINSQTLISDDELIIIKQALTRQINVLVSRSNDRLTTPDYRIKAHADMLMAIQVLSKLENL